MRLQLALAPPRATADERSSRRIVELNQDESDRILAYLGTLVKENHDAQVRFRWEARDVALWSNTSSLHNGASFSRSRSPRLCRLSSAFLALELIPRTSLHLAVTLDYSGTDRVGHRAVSLGDRPFFRSDAGGRSRREALGLPKWLED